MLVSWVQIAIANVLANTDLAVQCRIAKHYLCQELVIKFAKLPNLVSPKFPAIHDNIIMFDECRTTSLSLLWWWRSSGLAGRLGAWGAITDALDRVESYP